MKQVFAILSIAVILFSCGGRDKNQFTINGNVKGVDTGMVFILKNDAGTWIAQDSVKIQGGKFSFKGSVPAPEMYRLVLAGLEEPLFFFLENSAIEINVLPDSMTGSVVTGSATNDTYMKYRSQDDILNKKMDEMYTEYKQAEEKNDTVTLGRLNAASDSLDKEKKKLIVEFAKTNNTSIVAPYLIWKNRWQFELPEMEQIAVKFDTVLKPSKYYQSLNEYIGILQNVQVGKSAPDFTMNDSLGKPVTLSSLKGKYLLVDFWASWCGPCRHENPNVVVAYQGYHDKGFDVLGVSLDNSRDKWIEATKKDNLTWTHVSDLLRWQNAAAKLYGISSIPSNVLLDKDQVIIAKNLRGEDLRNKLAELLGPPAKAKPVKTTRKK
jgi:peroxiredoxin